MKDPILEAVSELKTTVTTRLDATDEKIETVKQEYQKDHRDLVEQVRKDGKEGTPLDLEKLEPAVIEIMDKQKVHEVENRLFNTGEDSNLRAPDPWSQGFDVRQFGGDLANPAELLEQDLKAMAGEISVKDPRAGMATVIGMAPTSELHKRVARMALDAKIADGIARGQHLINAGRGDYKGLASVYPTIAKTWGYYQGMLYEEMTGRKTDTDLMDTTDMGNWVPTAISAEVRELIMLELQVAAQFEMITMPRSPFQISVDLTDTEPIYMAETTALPAAYFTDVAMEVFDPSYLTLTARKLRGRMMASGELDEDAVIAIMPKMREKVVKEQAAGYEICIIDGQRTADIDTGGGGLAATNCRKAIDGLRYFVENTYSANYCDGGTFDLDILLRELRSKLTNAAGRAEYGMNPADDFLVPSIAAYLKMLVIQDGSLQAVTTIDKMGPNATIVRGQLGSVGGQRIIPSRFVRQDLNAAGIYDNVTKTKTIVICCNPKGFVLGQMRDVTVEATRIPHLDIFELVSFQRFDMQPWFGASHAFASIAYNITTA